MKKVLFLLVVIVSLASCRVADFTLLSTKNVDMNSQYTLKQSHVSAYAPFFLKSAVDKCIEKGGGTYLTNVVIYKRPFGYKVTGDVYGK